MLHWLRKKPWHLCIKSRRRRRDAEEMMGTPLYNQVCFMSIPRIKAKPDKALDEVTERDKILRPFFRIIDLILQQEGLSIKVAVLEKKRWELSIKTRKLSVKSFMKRYPNIFVIFTNPMDHQPWCKLTDKAMGLVEEEKATLQSSEDTAVNTLRRMLMMAMGRKIRADHLESSRRIFGFPHDFLDGMVPKYPHYFRPFRDGSHVFIELGEWDNSIAISEFEKRAMEDGIKKGLGRVEVNGQPFPFKISLSSGMALRKKNLEILESWQKLPYMSPYHDWNSSVKKGTPLSEKRLVCLLHEFLCLTIEKKARLRVIQPFRDEFQLPQKVIHLFEHFPGIFYMSHRGGIKTIMLREGYKRSRLIKDHPLVHVKENYLQMVNEGRRMCSDISKEKGYTSEDVDEVDGMEDDEEIVHSDEYIGTDSSDDHSEDETSEI